MQRTTTPPTRPSRRLASIEAAAEFYDVHPRTVRRLIAAGKLSAFRVGDKSCGST